MRFFVGLHHPHHAARFERCMVSANALRRRRSGFSAGEWIMDSGAFTEVARNGGYRHGPEEYAETIGRFGSSGRLLAAVSQDFMCEPFVLERTGKSVEEHQDLTIERYRALRALCPGVFVMPVLQGYHPEEYARHVRDYGPLLTPGAWVGVGSVCRRNATPGAVEDVLLAVYRERPDLMLHGFGLKLTALASGVARSLLFSADSMAWSYAARRGGRNANDWREALLYCERVEEILGQPAQLSLEVQGDGLCSGRRAGERRA